MADIHTFTFDGKGLPDLSKKTILTDAEKQAVLDSVQEQINQRIPEETLKRNNLETQRFVRNTLIDIMKQHKIADYVVVCDKTNNDEEVLKQKAFIADVLIKFDDTPGGSKIRLEYRPSPFDEVKANRELTQEVSRRRELPPMDFPGGNPFARPR